MCLLSSPHISVTLSTHKAGKSPANREAEQSSDSMLNISLLKTFDLAYIYIKIHHRFLKLIQDKKIIGTVSLVDLCILLLKDAKYLIVL